MHRLKIIVSVTNDLSSDQRVHKVCNTLTENNFEVLLVGRKLPQSKELTKRNYQTLRLKLLFKKGFIFYVEYQIRLFIFLIWNKFDVVHSNDLDTLLANFLAAKIKGRNIVYDSHEYFTEVPELTSHPLKRKIWLSIEKYIFPKLKYVFTVNNSIAEIYKTKYGVPVNVIRNVPLRNIEIALEDFHLPEFLLKKKYIILQGAGINISRGAEELVEAMQFVSEINLLIVGDGDVVPALHVLVEKLNLNSAVLFISKVPYSILMQYTKHAFIGVTLDKDTNLNYRFSLPNKIFDYIRAEIPVLASPLIETQRIFDELEIGCLIKNHEPKHIAEKINYMISNPSEYLKWKQNVVELSKKISWENESEILIKIYNQFR